MTTKLSRVVTYHERLPFIKSHDFLITLSCVVTWQTKTIVSPVKQWLRPPTLVGCWLTWRVSTCNAAWPFIHLVLLYTSATTIPIVTKIGMAVHHNKPQLINTAKKCPYSELFWSAFSRIRAPHLSIFSPNAEKFGPE